MTLFTDLPDYRLNNDALLSISILFHTHMHVTSAQPSTVMQICRLKVTTIRFVNIHIVSVRRTRHIYIYLVRKEV